MTVATKLRPQRGALYVVGHVQTCGFAEGGDDVHELDVCIVAIVLCDLSRPGDNERNVHRSFTESASLQNNSMVARHFPVVTHEDHDRAPGLTALVQPVQDAPQLVVDLHDHRVAAALDALPLVRLDLPGCSLEVHAGPLSGHELRIDH